MKVLIRADASLAIGFGHVARCLTLAQALRKGGAVVTFACRSLPGNALAQIAEQGFPAIGLPSHYPQDPVPSDIEASIDWQADFAAVQAAFTSQPAFDWLLVDHYGLDARWQQAARSMAGHIAVIDDLANRQHDADLLLDQNQTANTAAYARLIPAQCQALLGPHYALLRPEFTGEPIVIAPQIRHVVVSFGGVDAGGETFKALDALAAFPQLEVDIVAGAANPAWAQLQQRAAGQTLWRLHRFVSDFAALMREADLFIGAGGGTSWERAALGLPTICIAVAANQHANAEQLALMGVHRYLGLAETVSVQHLQQAIGEMSADINVRRGYAQHSRALVDGQGARRVAAALLTRCLQLRRATLDDAQLLFDGRNAPLVRRWSLDSAPIAWEQHLSWLTRTLQRPDRLLLIGEGPGGSVGMLRYDRSATQAERAEVSIYLFAGQEGMGWGQALLAMGDRQLTQHWPDVVAIDATVLPGNAASIKLFRQAGYQQADTHFVRIL
ncbi:UDP-2,4-diacetamido-2,4,6-trideoxy-beta-L-altropyranose hydrolase [Chitinimonas sp. BJB300]|uniref:UDP-2,4-diacetamido-2,4, 6-trideoxy-beta-L-altropyranose hydrolase n=1 Tax=Chitinimonas sp. BJB300 TaxID=1559339 RepID=UPI000C11E7A8|nr:UDP-2,4-diacetamido-2,4,6-trideoxy-beta-L-altropyranose hydrolase [Chitinimonas sp. BJB300]PHV12485.1 UDP-2,4-diacetamido-2,4,6-trideoxy-beta-L-altropyranose hydrolase [Chitinimonas sp. BJB300]TSJ89125.1 UDP-2,4-diacetamido-2,4,6-trideoxy-beta-L-altropyranose hydrolase [Chitinimonas sp. BJB300]